jgi:osmotically-inducible protein OsmY
MTVPAEGTPWASPADRYYYGWYGDGAGTRHPAVTGRSDSDLKSEAVDRLRANPLTSDYTLDVNVQAGVVVLAGDVPTLLAKRAAGDDCWDISGVLDVSNQMRITSSA